MSIESVKRQVTASSPSAYKHDVFCDWHCRGRSKEFCKKLRRYHIETIVLLSRQIIEI